MTELFLSDNSFALKRGRDGDLIVDDEGTIVTGLTARAFLSTSKAHGAVPIDASLDAAAVPITNGKLRQVFSGTNLRTYITPLLDTAEEAGSNLTIYGHVVVAGSHHDVEELLVKRERLVA
jgi:hypothetical protein